MIFFVYFCKRISKKGGSQQKMPKSNYTEMNKQYANQ